MQGPFAVAAPANAAAVAEETARTQANRRSKLRLGFAVSAVATAALIGIYFHVEVAAFLTGYPDLRDDFRELATQDDTRITQAVETSTPDARQSLKKERRSGTSANELAVSTQEAKAAQAVATAAELQRRALEEAQARAAALASELAGKSREIESQAAQSQKAVDAATKQKQAAESTIAELRQALEQEQQKTATVMQEAKAAQAIDDGRRTPAPRTRRGTGAGRGSRKRACWQEPRDREPGRAVAKGSRCRHETEAGGGEHYRGTATSSGAGTTEDRHRDAGSQGRTSDDDGRRTPAPRTRRGTGAGRGSRKRACWQEPRDRDARPHSRKRQSMPPRNRSRRRRAPSRNCDKPWSRSNRRPPP